jgi:hypothetical protein
MSVSVTMLNRACGGVGSNFRVQCRGTSVREECKCANRMQFKWNSCRQSLPAGSRSRVDSCCSKATLLGELLMTGFAFEW